MGSWKFAANVNMIGALAFVVWDPKNAVMYAPFFVTLAYVSIAMSDILAAIKGKNEK